MSRWVTAQNVVALRTARAAPGSRRRYRISASTNARWMNSAVPMSMEPAGQPNPFDRQNDRELQRRPICESLAAPIK
jgi:hypothetical protein